jgi:hypothetical protein
VAELGADVCGSDDKSRIRFAASAEKTLPMTLTFGTWLEELEVSGKS